MRILMLDNEFPPLGGGMGTVNEALLSCYARYPELEIDLITSALGGEKEEHKFADRIRVIKLPVWNRNVHHSTWRELLLYAAQALPCSIRRHRARRYDFCLAWSTLPAGVVAWVLYRLMGLKYAVWVSGPDIPGFERRYRYLYPALSPLIRGAWRNAKHVIAKCAGEVEMINSLDRRLKIEFIPNGVDANLFRPGLGIPDDGPLQILCVARLIERKGQRYLIEAVKRLTDCGIDVNISLVGTGDLQQEYQNLALRLGVQDHVRFLGYVPREQIAQYYGTAHVFVLPSYNEGMSLAVLEAMAAGLPVVVTPTGGTEELVTDGVNGLTFKWGDVDTLAKHLKVLAEDRPLAREMGLQSLARAKSFGWDAIADQFLTLMGRKPGAKVSPSLPFDADGHASL